MRFLSKSFSSLHRGSNKTCCASEIIHHVQSVCMSDLVLRDCKKMEKKGAISSFFFVSLFVCQTCPWIRSPLHSPEHLNSLKFVKLAVAGLLIHSRLSVFKGKKAWSTGKSTGCHLGEKNMIKQQKWDINTDSVPLKPSPAFPLDGFTAISHIPPKPTWHDIKHFTWSPLDPP